MEGKTLKDVRLSHNDWHDAANYAYPTGGNSSDGTMWAGIGTVGNDTVLLMETHYGDRTARLILDDEDLERAIGFVEELDLAYYGDDSNWKD